MRAFGLKLGVPAQIKVLFLENPVETPLEGAANVGIGEPVPWESFPFPKPPERLKPLDRHDLNALQTIGYTPLEASGARVMTIEWGRRQLKFQAFSQTPGLLHLHINGVLFYTLAWWDYNAVARGGQLDLNWDKLGPAPQVGQTTVTLTITPEHVGGDWMAAFLPVD
jgi:hypothetical protein